MKPANTRTCVTLLTLLLAASAARAPLAAQTCFGTPARGGLSADYGRIAFGTAVGATATMARTRTALALSARSVTLGPDQSGYGGDLRFSLNFAAGRVSICPGLGLGFQQTTWDAPLADLKSTSATGRAALGVGFEQEVPGGFSIIPFVAARYGFSLTKYDVTSSNVVAQTTADSVSTVDMQFGVLARYQMVYAGYIGDHLLSSKNASAARFVLGVTFRSKERD